MIRFSILALVVLVAASPASAQNREHQQIAADGRMLQEQVQQIAVSVSALSQALTEAITALNTRLNDAIEATRQGFADQKLAVGQPWERRSRHSRAFVGHQRPHREPHRGARSHSRNGAGAPAGRPHAGRPGSCRWTRMHLRLPRRLHRRWRPRRHCRQTSVSRRSGCTTVRTRTTSPASIASAISGFQALLAAFPKSEWADDAQLHIGDSYFLQNRWPEAIGAYNSVDSDAVESSSQWPTPSSAHTLRVWIRPCHCPCLKPFGGPGRP